MNGSIFDLVPGENLLPASEPGVCSAGARESGKTQTPATSTPPIQFLTTLGVCLERGSLFGAKRPGKAPTLVIPSKGRSAAPPRHRYEVSRNVRVDIKYRYRLESFLYHLVRENGPRIRSRTRPRFVLVLGKARTLGICFAWVVDWRMERVWTGRKRSKRVRTCTQVNPVRPRQGSA